MAGKRGNNEGSVYKVKDREGYRAAYWAETPDGEKKRRYVSGKTRAEVAKKLAKAIADRDGGLVLWAENPTLSDYLTRWLTDSVRGTVKQPTLENYEYVVRVHLTPALGRVKLRGLTPARVQALYRAKLDSGLSPRTVQLIHTVLHKALKQAVRWEMVAKNVAGAVSPPRPKKAAEKKVKPLTREQYLALREAARGERLEALYVLAVTAGLRQGELLGLRWEDVDLERGTLYVRRQLTRTKMDGLTFTEPKWNGQRSVMLTEDAVTALRRHHLRQAEERMKLPAGLWQDTGLVFTSGTGNPLDVGNMTARSFRPLLERAGLPRIRFHDLRHTCATLLLLAAVSPKVVQERLGHRDISVTLGTYSHVLPDMQEAAVKALDDLLASEAGAKVDVAEASPGQERSA